MTEAAPAARVLAITGPTAVGKTRLAIALAHAIDGEVISMDSRQVYRGMDIGTAKPTIEEREGVPHFGFDLVHPDERYNAGRFARDARRWIEEISARGHIPILAGGTGFFLRALTHPLFREPELDPERREALQSYLHGLATDRLRAWVDVLEPGVTAGSWAGGGRQRLERRIEVAVLSGHTLSWWQTHAPPMDAPIRPLTFVLQLPRAELYRRINERVLDMVRRGLPEEVSRLLKQGYTARNPGMNATGYTEFAPVFTGNRSVEEAIALTQAATRRYARRQHTWFRHQIEAAIPLDATRSTEELRDGILDVLKGNEP